MGTHRSKAERWELGKRAADLRDNKKLKWPIIAERLGVSSPQLLRVYYDKYKESAELALPRMDLDEARAMATRLDVEVGWVWLYENGYPDRVPQRVKKKIEDSKLEADFGEAVK